LKLLGFAGKNMAMPQNAGRPKGVRNRRLLLQEAEEALGKARTGEAMVAPLHVMETVMHYYFTRALQYKGMQKPEAEVDAAMNLALDAAERCAPYRHARIATIKLSGDPHNPLRMFDTATADELKAEIMKHLKILAPVLDLEPLMALADGSATGDPLRGGAGNGAQSPRHMKKRAPLRGDQSLGLASTRSCSRKPAC
jgi:hypothetical protein